MYVGKVSQCPHGVSSEVRLSRVEKYAKSGVAGNVITLLGNARQIWLLYMYDFTSNRVVTKCGVSIGLTSYHTRKTSLDVISNCSSGEPLEPKHTARFEVCVTRARRRVPRWQRLSYRGRKSVSIWATEFAPCSVGTREWHGCACDSRGVGHLDYPHPHERSGRVADRSARERRCGGASGNRGTAKPGRVPGKVLPRQDTPENPSAVNKRPRQAFSSS